MTAIERFAESFGAGQEGLGVRVQWSDGLTVSDLRLAADCIACVRALANQQDWQGDSGQVLTTMTIDGTKLSALAARIKEGTDG